MEKEPLFFESYHEDSDRFLVIEETEGSIWAYLTLPNTLQIERHCFLGSRIKVEISEVDIQSSKANRMLPPITTKFASEFCHQPTLDTQSILAFWTHNEAVMASLNGSPFLFFIPDDCQRGYCKAISKNGPYGNAWNESKFQEFF